MREKKFRKPKGLVTYIFGLAIIALGVFPTWTFCMDTCSPGSINIGFIAAGVSMIALQALYASKMAEESKGGCAMMLNSVLIPVTLLSFAVMSNGWALLSLGPLAVLLGLVLLIVGAIKLSKAQK
jgi:heme/copper-type cytochrome/quinol oxidase subunit 4